ncbi:hypothetical protein P3T73_13120 [Kiritimatiellota bacterium B12222]|nr:hypothetical protein P3T73_13120 [Kiritimatiellota bacterium B12222]
MKQLKMYTLLLMIFIYLSAGCSAVDPEAYKFDISVKVEDENSDPVENAVVRIRFDHTYIQQSITDKNFHRVSELSDTDGVASISSKGNNRIYIHVERENYWDSFGKYDYWEVNKDAEVVGLDSSHIHKEFIIKLKNKKNPRPLYVNGSNLIPMPKSLSPIAYDLEECDWVSPYGKGKVPDVIFNFTKHKFDDRAYEAKLTLTFTNPEDGLIPVMKSDNEIFTSELLLGRNAPITGYIKEYSLVKGLYKENDRYIYRDDPKASELNNIEGYWFRVRTKINPETGEILEARYGKIYTEINFSARSEEVNTKIGFMYYFSPDQLNSLEFNGESLIPDADLQGMYRK